MSSWPIVIRYEGKPQGKGRPRFGKGNTYTPIKTKKYEDDLRWIAKSAVGRLKPLEGPVGIEIVAHFKSKKRGYHTIKPDADNIAKGCCDALNGIAYLDDSQVANLVVDKYFAAKDSLYIH